MNENKERFNESLDFSYLNLDQKSSERECLDITGADTLSCPNTKYVHSVQNNEK